MRRFFKILSFIFLVIFNQSPVFANNKIISEGIGITTTLLKTGEVEENVYLTSTKNSATIHAPDVVTGSVEVVAQKITDLTGLATMAYDVAVSKETRSQIYSQFVEIKNEIGEDPKAFVPILVDVVVTVTINKTPEQIQSVFDEKTDAGQRTHYAVSSTGNAIVTVMAGAAIVKDLPEIAEKLGENIKKVKKLGQNLGEFVSKSLAEKLDDIKNIWKTKYPAWEMMEGRSFFEKIMREYRYTKADGWAYTANIAHNFKGVDFYKDFTVSGNKIYAETAVSMKTTKVTDVNKWLASEPIQKNIGFLEDGFKAEGLASNGKRMFITNAEIHIYMPRKNITEALRTEWLNKLSTINSKIKFEIRSLEDFVK